MPKIVARRSKTKNVLKHNIEYFPAPRPTVGKQVEASDQTVMKSKDLGKLVYEKTTGTKLDKIPGLRDYNGYDCHWLWPPTRLPQAVVTNFSTEDTGSLDTEGISVEPMKLQPKDDDLNRLSEMRTSNTLQLYDGLHPLATGGLIQRGQITAVN